MAGVLSALATAELPLTGAALANEPTAQPYTDTAGWTVVGHLKVKGGTLGTDFVYTPGNVQYNGADYGTANVVEVLTDTPLTFTDADGYSSANPGATGIQVNPGVHADITLDNVHIAQRAPFNVMTNQEGGRNNPTNPTRCHITLADGSKNGLLATTGHTNGYFPALRCGETSVLVIDDTVRNTTEKGGNVHNQDHEILPVNGMIGKQETLSDGTTLKPGDSLTRLDSKNPGTLNASGGWTCAAIGGSCTESSGRITINGGIINAQANNQGSGSDYNYWGGAAIGGGHFAGSDGLVFNSGTITAQASYHGAAIGAGYAWLDSARWGTQWPDAHHTPSNTPDGGSTAGDITINGGFIRAKGDVHGNAFGQACWGTNNKHVIRITGGTLIPSSAGDRYDIGGQGSYVIITGGSVNCNKGSGGAYKFQGIGNTAYNTPDVTNWDDLKNYTGGSEANTSTPVLPNSDKVQMITIDLSAEIIKTDPDSGAVINDGNNVIEKWELYVAGEKKNYGAPYQFDNGKLYLWLPTSDINKTISVELSYRDNEGNIQKVDPLFREPGAGSTLKSYIDFDLPDIYLDKLTKPYDGTPFEAYDLENNPITTTEDIPKTLDKLSKVTYVYQLYDKRQGTALGPEISSAGNMPTDAGVMKFVMTSKQFSDPDPDDNIDPKFKERYWGHRATGWCEITPIPSKVDLLSAEWVISGKPGDDPHDSSQQLKLSAIIANGETVDGKPLTPDKSNATADTCKAPEGRVQLYVDGKPVGDPIEILFADKTDDDDTVHKANATRVDNGAGGSSTAFNYVFVPSQADYLVPDATTDNKHIISVQYLPPAKDSDSPANYLESINPTKNPETAPKVPVAIDPIDPNPTVSPEADPENTDGSTPPPDVTTSTAPKPVDPNADPAKPGDKAYTGTIVTTWDEPSDANPHPGRVTLKVHTPSTGPIAVTGEDGGLYEADFVRDKDGNPVRNDDGTYTLVLDPEKLGTGKLTFTQKPNGAYTGTSWTYDVTVRPNPKIAPITSVTKRAENLTHPNGPTQPGDRIRYTVQAKNDAAGSAWNDVAITDALPACLTLDGATVRLDNSAESLKSAALKAAAAGAAPALGEYALSDAGTDGRRTLTVPAGRVYGVGAATLTFECTVNADAADRGTISDLANIAEATGTRAKPDDPTKDEPENPKPSDPATPPKSPTVAPADPEIKVAKAVENADDAQAKVTRVGDTLHYTITLENTGAANSCLQNALISDPLPTGLTPVDGTLTMTLPDGTERAVDDGAYDEKTRTIAVTAGDLWGGQRVTLAFDVTVGEAALGANNANIATVHGTVPSKGPGGTPTDPEPGNPTTPPTGTPEAFTPPATPPTLVGEDPDEGDISLDKKAENTSRDDGKTAVGDKIRYVITLKNDHTGTAWMDALVKDEIPEGLEPETGSILLTLPDGTEQAVDDAAYDEKTRILAVTCGHLYGGQEVKLSFTAIVTEAAVDADIGNVAVAVGTLPSKWNPDAENPAPGSPFAPPSGWPAYERGHETVKSPAAYPPGTDEKGGVLKGPGSDATTIAKKRLAQTGDEMLAALTMGVALAASAAAIALLARRRLNRR